MTKLIQRGLYTKSEKGMEAFADRVDTYNRSKGMVVVEMEGREADGNELCPEPHWEINLEFASRAYAKDFWTDPAYQEKVYVPSSNDNQEPDVSSS
jgi:hypothetical protein